MNYQVKQNYDCTSGIEPLEYPSKSDSPWKVLVRFVLLHISYSDDVIILIKSNAKSGAMNKIMQPAALIINAISIETGASFIVSLPSSGE